MRARVKAVYTRSQYSKRESLDHFNLLADNGANATDTAGRRLRFKTRKEAEQYAKNHGYQLYGTRNKESKTMKSNREAGFSTIETAVVMVFLLALVAVMTMLVIGAGAPTNKVTEAITDAMEDLPATVNEISDNTDGWELVGDNAIRKTIDNAFDNGDADVDITLPVTPDVPVELLELARSIEDEGGSIEDVIAALSEQEVNVVLMQAILSELGFNTPSQ